METSPFSIPNINLTLVVFESGPYMSLFLCTSAITNAGFNM